MADEQSVEIATQQEEAVDFDKELEEEVARIERAEQARKHYAIRHQDNSKEKTTETPSEDDDAVTKAAEKVLSRILPKLEATTASAAIEMQLGKLTDDPSLQKLIRHHFENSVTSVGSIQERLEMAHAIAMKKVIAKQAKELNVAFSNRQQISNSGMGQHSQSIAEPKDNILSQSQINSLKAQGWDDKKIETLKKNLLKRQ